MTVIEVDVQPPVFVAQLRPGSKVALFPGPIFFSHTKYGILWLPRRDYAATAYNASYPPTPFQILRQTCEVVAVVIILLVLSVPNVWGERGYPGFSRDIPRIDPLGTLFSQRFLLSF
jgi:hypothetical protein